MLCLFRREAGALVRGVVYADTKLDEQRWKSFSTPVVLCAVSDCEIMHIPECRYVDMLWIKKDVVARKDHGFNRSKLMLAPN
jgi:hypothetical protein